MERRTLTAATCFWGSVLALALGLVISAAPREAVAGTTGKITGAVVDGKKVPLVGVNIAIPTARLGAMTDAGGRYAIFNVPAGTYDVKVAMLGYRATTITGVVVSADNTTVLDATLLEAPIAMDEVVVSARRAVVDLKLTSNLATVSREEISALPVQELQDIVNLQAGVVSQGGDLHFRGGRGGEVQYQVDGVSVNNAFDNKTSLRLDRSLLEEVQVISGTFDAEYGQAMSGVVNAVLRRGTDQFRWDAEALTGGFVFAGGDRRQAEFDFHPAGLQNYQVSVSGPLVANTTFLMNARRYRFEDYFDATRRFLPWHTASDEPADKVLAPDGDGRRGSLGYSREWSGLAKITNRSIKNLELNYQAVINFVDSRRADFAYRLNPDGLPRQRTTSIAHGLDWTHTLSRSRYYNLSFRHNYFDYRDMVYDDALDPRYDAAGPPDRVPGYENDAIVQGVDLARFKQNTDAVLVKTSYVDQVSDDQQVKLGAEFQWPRVRFGADGVLSEVSGNDSTGTFLQRKFYEPPDFPGIQLYVPYIASGYVQDDLEWNDLRLRAGVRFDYFNARAGVPSDLANPANSISGAPQSDWIATTRKHSISPRVGVSYPVTKDAALFFAYGHFSQMPAIGEIFRNSDYRVLNDLQAGDPDYRVMGNPDIKPERTVHYQFGYKQAVTDWLGVDVSTFYKDIRDLLGVEFISTYNGAEYARLTNVDFGTVAGFTVAIDQRRRGILSSSLDYTWQLAQGNASNPRETATRAEAGEDPRPRQIPFNWDQRHTVNATVTASRDNDWVMNAVVRAASGQPYTPTSEVGFGFGLEANSGRRSAAVAVDLAAEKIFRLRGAAAAGSSGSAASQGPKIRAFTRVYNLFDVRFFNGYVFDTTGSPYYARDPARDAAQLANPLRFYAPRRIEVGVSMQVGG